MKDEAQNPQPQQPTQATPLSNEQVLEMRRAYLRLQELTSSSLTMPGKDEEIENIKHFIGSILVTHASEFIGAWLTMNNEYGPLIAAVSKVLGRALQPMMPPQQAQSLGGKIVPLKKGKA
jgi:hypothetical protein